jgi:lysozyme
MPGGCERRKADDRSSKGMPTGVERPRWRTSFFLRPDRDWAVWQVHYFARVDGVHGRVDLDVVRPS